MTDDAPGLNTRLRGLGQREEGLEKAMAFSAVRRALVGDDAPPGDFGKYKVLERLGAGGMGAVFAAWDPELERRVALKVLTGGGEAEAEQALLLREAKAAAQLSHPNVVTVFEVGTALGRVFLAMEYVRGETLRAWAKGDHTGASRLAVLMQAGRGLAAAHARGLVHRDFKPDNVLVDAAGQAKVVDFGLAHSASEVLGSGDPSRQTLEQAAAITQTGPRSGTPDYMAPEQLRGGAADARSDQFAFAVTAWEVLCGERPFEENAQAEGAPPRGRPGVPRAVTAALTRALSADPRARFDSMEALLHRLDPTARTARRTRGVLGGASVLAVGGVLWGARSQQSPLCVGLEEGLVGVWDPARREADAQAFATADPEEGAAKWAAVETTLQGYADAWVDASTQSCEATRLRGAQSDAMFTQRTRCLAGRLRALQALTDRLADADAKTIARAPDAAATLPPIDRCADPEVLGAQVEPPAPHLGARVEDLQAILASIDAAERLGQYAHVAEAMPSLVEAAMAVDYPPLHAEVKLEEGRIHRRMKALPEARAALERASRDALASGHDHVLADALGLLALLVGHDLSQREEGLRVAELAQAALDRIGGDPELQAQLASRRGLIHLTAGDLAQARAELETAKAGFEARWPGGIQTGDTLNNLSNISISLGELERASDELAQAIAIFEHHHGPSHPAVGAAITNRAIVLRRRGLLDEARAEYLRAREIFVTNVGPEHPQVAAIDLNRGNVELEAGNVDAALELLDDATTRLEAALGSEHAWVASALKARADARSDAGQQPGARADVKRAIALLEASSPGALDLASAYCSLGIIEGRAGDPRASDAAFSRSFALYADALGEETVTHPDVVLCREAQAEVASTP